MKHWIIIQFHRYFRGPQWAYMAGCQYIAINMSLQRPFLFGTAIVVSCLKSIPARREEGLTVELIYVDFIQGYPILERLTTTEQVWEDTTVI